MIEEDKKLFQALTTPQEIKDIQFLWQREEDMGINGTYCHNDISVLLTYIDDLERNVRSIAFSSKEYIL